MSPNEITHINLLAGISFGLIAILFLLIYLVFFKTNKPTRK